MRVSRHVESLLKGVIVKGKEGAVRIAQMATHHKVAMYIHQHLYGLPFKHEILHFGLRQFICRLFSFFFRLSGLDSCLRQTDT